MRRRSRSNRTSSGSKRRTDWVTSSATYGTGGNAGLPWTILSDGSVNPFELCGSTKLGGTANPLVIDRFMINSIIGETKFLALSGTADYGTIDVGIIKVQTSNVGSSLYNPFSQSDAESPWLYLKHYKYVIPTTVAVPQFPITDVSLPNGEFLHVKTKRNLIENERLVLFISMNSLAATPVLTNSVKFVSYLRVLVSRIV